MCLFLNFFRIKEIIKYSIEKLIEKLMIAREVKKKKKKNRDQVNSLAKLPLKLQHVRLSPYVLFSLCKIVAILLVR